MLGALGRSAEWDVSAAERTSADAAQAGSIPPVRMTGISKTYGETVANDQVDFELDPGDIHALLGENGAGKTTLVRVLFGSVRPDAGDIELDGRPVTISSPAAALELGVALVHQHPRLVPALSVAENLLLGEAGGALLRPSRVREEARALLAGCLRWSRQGRKPPSTLWGRRAVESPPRRAGHA